MNNQGAGSSVTSDSLVRFQMYAALAFGAKGLYIYCWGLGVVNIPEHHDPQGHPWRLPGTPSVIYPCKYQSSDTSHPGRIDAVFYAQRTFASKVPSRTRV